MPPEHHFDTLAYVVFQIQLSKNMSDSPANLSSEDISLLLENVYVEEEKLTSRRFFGTALLRILKPATAATIVAAVGFLAYW